VRTSPEHIVVCSGWSQALCLVADVLREQGARAVAFEDPCNPAYRRAVERTGIAVRALPVDADGADPSALTDASDIAAAVLTPAHQYPTGTTLAPHRRAAFVEWARAHDALLLEDDYDGELRYDRQPVGALQALDPERVVYAGTVSKSLAPALRLAWMAVPARMVEPLREAKRLTDRQTPALDQLALADLIARGTFDRHLRAMRTRYRRRRDLLVAAVRERTPELAVEGIAAGLHVVIRLPARGPGERAVSTRSMTPASRCTA
jgi:GntR family transcriptional regulator/MocR family aminotransferase